MIIWKQLYITEIGRILKQSTFTYNMYLSKCIGKEYNLSYTTRKGDEYEKEM